MSARYLAIASAGATFTSNGSKRKKIAANAKLVSGPTTAIRNSALALGGSPAIWDTPPKMNRVIRLYGYFVAKGHPRMGQFVHNDAGKKQDCCHSAHQPVFGARATLEFNRIVINGQHPSD